MEKKSVDVSQIQSVSTGNEAWICDINTGICGPVSTTQETIEPLQVDFFKTVKNNKSVEREDNE